MTNFRSRFIAGVTAVAVGVASAVGFGLGRSTAPEQKAERLPALPAEVRTVVVRRTRRVVRRGKPRHPVRQGRAGGVLLTAAAGGPGGGATGATTSSSGASGSSASYGGGPATTRSSGAGGSAGGSGDDGGERESGGDSSGGGDD